MELAYRGWVGWVHREKNRDLPGCTKKLNIIYHVVDKKKLDILTNHGGTIADFGLYFIRGKRIRTMLKDFHALTCYGDEDGDNMGLVGGSKYSRPIRAWRRSYQVIYRKNWNLNSSDVPTFLSEIFLGQVYVVNHICYYRHPYDMDVFYLDSRKR